LEKLNKSLVSTYFYLRDRLELASDEVPLVSKIEWSPIQDIKNNKFTLTNLMELENKVTKSDNYLREVKRILKI